MARKVARQTDPAAEQEFANGEAYARMEEYEKAVVCYTQAAQAGHGEAECRLGACYEEGKGVARSDAEAVAHYRRAAINE